LASAAFPAASVQGLPQDPVHLIVGHVAETPLERERHQRHHPLGDERQAEDHDADDRGDGSERPKDDAAGLPPAVLGVEKPRLRADLRHGLRVGHGEAGQWQRRAAFEAQGPLPAIDRAQIVIAPRRRRDAVFADLKRRTEGERDRVPAIGEAVEENRRSDRRAPASRAGRVVGG